MARYLQVFFFLLLLLVTATAGDGFYADATPSYEANIYNIVDIDTDIVQIDIITSHMYKAGSMDDILITFIGEFSSSGPHNVGKFADGDSKELSVSLLRRIGDIKSLRIEKPGVDGWLLAYIRCIKDNISYEFESIPLVWLDPDGFELESQLVLPAVNVLTLQATKTVAI